MEEGNKDINLTTATEMSPATTKEGEVVVEQEVKGCGGTTEPNRGGGVADGNGGGVSSSAETTVLIKRKRGRPRRVDIDHHQNHVSTILNVSPPPGFSSSLLSRSSEKRGRGRPRGSGRLQLLASVGEFLFFIFSMLFISIAMFFYI